MIGLVILLTLTKAIGGSLPPDDADNVLHIGGIFPIAGEGGWQGGQACMPAVNLALDDVNREKNLLPGFILKLHSNDSEPGLGASVMYNLLYYKPHKLMLLAGCSTVCTTVAEAAKMWNLVVVSVNENFFLSTSTATMIIATVHNPTRIKLLQKFGWSRVAILQQAEEVFISTVEDLEARCKEAGIEIVTRQSFLSDPSDAVRNLRRQDARIIVGLFYVVAARRVLCELYQQKLYGKSYVWFFIGWYEDNWFEVNLDKEAIACTKEQMRLAAEGHLTTEALMWNQNNDTTISGMTSEDFRQRLNKMLKEDGYDIDNNRYPEGYQEAPLAYDAVWSVALAFNKTMEKLSKQGKSLKNFTYTDKETADEIYSAINSTQFLGVSGFVAFSSQGDRIALTQIEQVIDGKYVKLGYYDTQSDNLTWRNMERWIGGKVPQDRTIIRTVLRTVSLPLFICMGTISSVGIAIAMGLIIFNIWNRQRRVIMSSHPVCNTIMLVGVIACFVSVFLLGIDGRFIAPWEYPAICQARAWMLSTGFTLAFGAMFSKVWRVHRLTTKTKADQAKLFMAKQKVSSIQKKIQPWKLYTMVSGLLVVDIVLLVSWQVLDPLQRKIETFPLESPPFGDDDARIRPELEHCESIHNNIWLGLIYSYKGLILVFGLFLAYETRSIKVKQINDSRYVGMSIYNVVVLCLITAPVTMVIASQQDASFAFVALAIIFCCFLSMALIFVPKVIEVIRHPKDKAESKYNPDVGMSKEDEERYQKLLSENDELQKLIAALSRGTSFQKEEKIKLLKQTLAERDALKGGSGNVPKDSLIVADFVTGEGTSDSAIGGGISVYTQSSRASASDFEFSGSNGPGWLNARAPSIRMTKAIRAYEHTNELKAHGKTLYFSLTSKTRIKCTHA
ncbi:Gamma-aminobutyric acid type B receptor subunit 1 [Melipona quadrifasciata]|uniref:Gamma-aminobutyric acid type B receptor subunit 1 n=1 Tax=Melipona quadrifasciata TaxID=166423 RepID=A0A0M9AA59_9HYME|nr:Gamma-aminobutyric acid type B receptor subunit 1 [Melipona quadrifasciata]